MEYVVTSPTQVFGKSNGEKFTEQELLALGAKIDRLLKAGTLTKNAVNVPPARQEPQVSKTPEVTENKSTNYEGDK